MNNIEVLMQDDRGWVTAIINGRWVQAKVYENPSRFGVNNGKVSKISIGKTDSRDPGKPFFEQMDYNYDRGLDFCHMDEEEVNEIVEVLEQLRWA